MVKAVAAVDLGATSGRVMLGYVGHNELRLVPVSRFPNGPVETPDGLHWNITGLYEHALAGLTTAAAQEPELVSVGVDSWAVDYALLNAGRALGEPFHYRDARTATGVAAVHERVAASELYASTGLQHLPFNTVFQLAEDAQAGRLAAADSFLLVPDLLGFWLTGTAVAERSNASTTGLFNATTGEWDDDLIRRVGLPRSIFPTLIDAGARLGGLRPELAARVGTPNLQVTTVGSHDTASAIVAIPAADTDFAYISCGTWSLVGVELEKPILSEASRAANFTNEGGVDGRVRYLRNVMGLWLLSETVRLWNGDLTQLLEQAAAYDGPVAIFDPDDERFLPPGDMPARIAAWCEENGIAAPGSRPALVRSILESLAAAYARTIDTARALSGATVNTVHLVGGGSQNALLCQLTADATGIPVVAGPVEATAIGNVLVQARAAGIVSGDLETLRALVARSVPRTVYLPR
ncbi:rhamnulokinase [Glaciihabitans arcticus]|uniref:Rhamnulokinase n=1 Tax=Glaciihabitans arcticus TaxID=2668039 RepID=A0A4Q9GU65_9MICO|nr:rhamnulokinase family protein [Glaciihabitans arcticus]TBN58255.1 rhamnulokinase [Glaciihabitans arcticus]